MLGLGTSAWSKPGTGVLHLNWFQSSQYTVSDISPDFLSETQGNPGTNRGTDGKIKQLKCGIKGLTDSSSGALLFSASW